MNVTWEDTARFQGSCWGPNISDMTLKVSGHMLPIIRHENFTDFTLDVDSNEIMLNIGNEKNSVASENTLFQAYLNSFLKCITLTEYLSNLDKYLTNPSSLVNGKNLMKNKG